MSRVTLCVAESESGPGVLLPGRLSVHGPTLLVVSVAAATSRLGFCPVHPSPYKPAPSLRGGHSLLLSQFPHLLDGGGVPETLVPPSPPLPGAPGLASPGDSDVERESSPSPLSTFSTLSACFLLAAGSCLLVTSFLTKHTLLPHDLCLVGNMPLFHNMSFLNHFPGVQLSSDSCQKHKLLQGTPTV